jgi:23S rRNA (pseudouridine1915-N3)-methyltransferase
MHWHVFAIGKPKLGFARDGIEEYATRLRPLAAVTIDYLKPAAGEEESATLLRRSEGMYRVALDERGAQFTSRDLAAKVGGAAGHSPALRAKADITWALGKLTLQHELALVVVMEQIYRAYAIKAGLPYHRD